MKNRIEPTLDEFIKESTNSINEAELSDYEEYKLALTKYKNDRLDKHDDALSAIFRGSKITSRFIFRSLKTPTESLYNMDCKDFGKSKIDELVQKVLNIIK